MTIEYSTNKVKRACRKLEDIFHSSAFKSKPCKDRSAVLYAKIISLIESSENFEMLMKNPLFSTYRGHELKENLAGCWAFDMVHPQRFVFRLLGEYKSENGKLNYTKVEVISIEGIIDYH